MITKYIFSKYLFSPKGEAAAREVLDGHVYAIFVPHFRLHEVVALYMCVPPYKFRKILEMLFKLMKVIRNNGEQGRGGARSAVAVCQHHP